MSIVQISRHPTMCLLLCELNTFWHSQIHTDFVLCIIIYTSNIKAYIIFSLILLMSLNRNKN